MKKVFLFAISLFIVLLFTVNAYAYSVLFEHIGNTDPTNEGWSKGPGVGVTCGEVTNDGGYDAWYVSDPSTSDDTYLSYSKTLTDSQKSNAATGWKMEATLRVVSGSTGVYQSLYIGYSDGNKHWLLYFDTNAAGDPIVIASNGLDEPLTYTLTGLGSTYHEYSLRYDPVEHSADLFVDDILCIEDYMGYYDPKDDAKFSWGAGSSNGTGCVNYSAVRFSAAPIPGSMLLLGSGLLGLVGIRRRFKKA